MHKFKLTLITASIVSLLGLFGSQAYSQENTSQVLVERISDQLQLKYQIVDNHAAANGVDCSALGADWGACNKIVVKLHNNGDAIDSKDWAIYFHSIRLILKVDSDQFTVTHITGDLHKLEPTDKFAGFAANADVEVPMIGEYWQVSQTDAIPRWYVVSGDAKKVIKSTDTEDLSRFVLPITGDQWKRTPDDKNILMTPISRFARNQDVEKLLPEQLRGQIIPSPMKVTIGESGVDLANVQLNIEGLPEASKAVLAERFVLLGVKVGSGYPIDAKIDAATFTGKPAGSYNLSITDSGASVIGADEAGIFYGIQSILSLIPATESKTVATLTAEDAPRFDYRGIFLDIGRNFKTKDVILRLLDQMAAYKINVFHFHLSDDEGWRIEIPGLPELTDVGSKRCHDLSETHCLLPQLGSGPESNNLGSGYFSKQDYIDIVKYANDRFIQVIPEIDIPAHARAAVVSMEARYKRLHAEGKEAEANEFRLVDPTDTSNTTSVQFYNRQSYLNPCLDSSKRFIDKIVGEIANMHKEAGQPLKTWHFGGDEAKNIRLGAGFQDINAKEKVNWKGTIDQSKEDLPWAKSQVCQQMVSDGKIADIEHLPSYFAVEVSKIIKNHNINGMQAWQDGLKHAENAKSFATENVAVNFWDTIYWGGAESASQWAQKGYKIVVSSPDYVYFDFPYEVSPLESGYYWGTRFNDERKAFSFAPNNLPQNAETSVDRDGNGFSSKSDIAWSGAYGLSAQLWNEIIRTDAQLEYMAFPRLLSLAERAWHKANWELDFSQGREFKYGETNFVDQKTLLADWTRFANIVGQRELAKLEKAKIDYRLPVPGAKVAEGKLVTNISLPGIKIEFSITNGDSWQTYSEPVSVSSNDTILVRSVSYDGKRTSRIEKVE